MKNCQFLLAAAYLILVTLVPGGNAIDWCADCEETPLRPAAPGTASERPALTRRAGALPWLSGVAASVDPQRELVTRFRFARRIALAALRRP